MNPIQAIDVALGRDPTHTFYLRLEGETVYWTLTSVETGNVTGYGSVPLPVWRTLLLKRLW